MDHHTMQNQLFALYDGELSGEARRLAEAHALDCAECRALLSQRKRVAGTLFRSPEVSTSEGFVEGVMQRIAMPPPRRARLPRWILEGSWLVPAVGLAAMLLIMIQGPLQQTVSIESLLLSDGREPAAVQEVLSGERPSADDVLGLLMEEGS